MSLPARHGDFHDIGVYTPAGGHGGQERLLDLPQLLSILRRHARLIASTLVLAALAAVAYSMLVAPQFTASATILVDPREQRVLGTKAVIEGIGQDAAFVESQVGLIQSPSLSARVVEKLKLTEDPEFAEGSLLSRIIGFVKGGAAAGDPVHAEQVLRNETIERFREHLGVRRRGLTYVLDVQFSSIDPEKAARIANAIADAYIEDQIATKSGATAGASRWLSDRIDELRGRVSASERAVAAYKETHDIVEFGDAQTGDTLNKRQIESLNQQLIAARARTADSLAKYQQVKRITEGGADPGSLPDAHKSDVLSRLRVQQATVARTEAEYSLTYGSEHPFLKQVRAQLANIRSEINKELSRILASAKTEYEIAKSRESSLKQSLAALGRESASDNKVAVHLRELEREAQADRELFNQFLSRAKETTEESALHVADARIVSRALVPVTPSSPGLLLVLAIALTGGVATASGLVLVAENMARGYRSRQALEADVGVACHGICPEIEAGEIPAAGRPNGGRTLFSRASRGISGALARGGEWGPGYRRGITRYCLDRPHGAFADAIRAVRLGLFGINMKTRPRSLVVTSALPGEGKSTVAANLANDLARSGLTTLLVDADFRRASLTRLLAGEAYEGLSEVLGGHTTMKRAVVYNPDTGLFFLPAGLRAADNRAGDLLTGRAFAEFLRHYGNSFDAIIIDGPPALSSPDAAALLDNADGTLLVVQWEKTPRDAVMAALNMSPFSRHKIRGCLLNRADRRELSSYGYGARRVA